MTAALARAVMLLATRCMGQHRGEWARAMRVEFELAAADRRAFEFAAGCLAVAVRELPLHAEGRLDLAKYAVALGLLIPMAALQVALALGLPSFYLGAGWAEHIVLAGATGRSYFQHSVALVPMALWLSIGLAHLRLAWTLVACDWERVVATGALIAATTTTLFILMSSLFLNVTFVVLQAAALAVELTVLAALARRHAQVQSDSMAELATR